MFETSTVMATLAASDLDRAKTWYAEKLGLEPVMEDDERGGAVFEAGGSRFLVYLTEFAGTNKATAMSLAVDNFDEVVNQLRANGVRFQDVDFGEMGKTVDGVITSPDGSESAAWFEDSEGNILNISTPPSE